ncbi:MAG: J domain-containing protein [Deltaproteobacteria bacterium]|nr:J domain-containing protein [Deltaproteobacteria bacterium]
MKKIILILLAAAYAASPYDLVPDFLIGWGWLDDLLVLYLLYRYVLFPAAGRSARTRGSGGQGREHARQDSAAGGRSGFEDKGPSGRTPGLKDPYSVLGLDRGASRDEIQKAYRALANKYHPDKVQHLGEEFRALAEDRFKEIRQAYVSLME